ncbi:MAG: KEOPS complex subunit Cgi121 [Methanofollis sp.]|nr:KEOPS complex subunit Cgi121 [Methanofollis sp.]
MNECEVKEGVIEVNSLPAFLRKMAEVAEMYQTHIICFDADEMAGRGHVEKAVRHAVRSWQKGRAISRSLEMEALLYAAGTRQCRIGTEMGLHEGTNRSYVCFCPPSPEATETLGEMVRWVDEDWEEIDPTRQARLMKRFEITEEELEAADGRLALLVYERVALLEINR